MFYLEYLNAVAGIDGTALNEKKNLTNSSQASERSYGYS